MGKQSQDNSEKFGWLKSFFKRRQHPIKIITYTSKNLWLLIIPLTKYLVATQFDFQSWIKTNWLDMLIIIGIVALALLRWLFIYYDIEDDGIRAHFGLFGFFHTKVYFSEITTFSCTQGYIYNAVNACNMYIETNALTMPKTDLMLVLSEKNVEDIFNVVTAQGADLTRYSITSKRSHLLVFSLLFSSALSGMIWAVTFLYEIYKFVGREIEEKFFIRVNGEITRIDSELFNITSKIPKAILFIGGFVLASWLISFTSNVMRHWNFVATRCGSQYIIKSGVLSKRKHVINRSKVVFLDFKQTLFMKLFKINSVAISCTGYGKKHRELSALIPITTDYEMATSLKIIYPDVQRPKMEVKTGGKDLLRFTLLPLLYCTIPPIAGTILKMIFPRWTIEINILMIVTVLPLLWLLVVKIVAAYSTGTGFKKGYCTVAYCHWFQYHKIIIPKEKISKVAVAQNYFQRISKTCTVYVFANEETTKYHKMKSLPYDKVVEIYTREGFTVVRDGGV